MIPAVKNTRLYIRLYRILCLLLSVMICALPFTVEAELNMGDAFDKRHKYKNATSLGNPDETNEFIKGGEDTSSWQNLDDSSLMSGGQDNLNGSEHGQFLQDSDTKKIEAMNRYKINSENALLKASYKLEEDPMSKTGGSNLGSTVLSTKTKTKKTCIEGVDFNVDIGLELVLDAYEEDYLGPMQKESRIVDIPGDAVFHGAKHLGYPIHWKRKRNGWHLKQDSSGWRQYLSNYLGIPLENIDGTITFPYGARGKGGGTHFLWDPAYPHNIVFNIYSFGYVYQFQEKLKRLVEKGEYWRVTTPDAEKLAESNECYEIRRSCLKSGVKKFFGKYEVSRPCWYEKITYACKSEPKDGCAHLIKQDCVLQDSDCEYKIGSLCMRWKRHYLCGGQKRELKFSMAGSPIYCLGGDCHTPTLEENQDFANVAYLAALNEAKKDCVKEPGGLCKNPITVFPGSADGCKKIIVSFIDCCSSMKGWGQNVNLCRCSGGEKGLALKREKGLCHQVGTYCHQKDPVFGVCLVKKTNFCCFGSKLARIFHEQGRQQLGISWGSSTSPNCRPLTLTELTRLDFSKFDMEELFDALLSKGKKNMHKSFPTLTPGEIPDIQKEHMKTTSGEKREIRKRNNAEEEQKRLAKLQQEKASLEKTTKLRAKEKELKEAEYEYQRVYKIYSDHLRNNGVPKGTATAQYKHMPWYPEHCRLWNIQSAAQGKVSKLKRELKELQ